MSPRWDRRRGRVLASRREANRCGGVFGHGEGNAKAGAMPTGRVGSARSAGATTRRMRSALRALSIGRSWRPSDRRSVGRRDRRWRGPIGRRAVAQLQEGAVGGGDLGSERRRR